MKQKKENTTHNLYFGIALITASLCLFALPSLSKISLEDVKEALEYKNPVSLGRNI